MALLDIIRFTLGLFSNLIIVNRLIIFENILNQCTAHGIFLLPANITM